MDDLSDYSWEKKSGGVNDFVRKIPILGGIFGGPTAAETNQKRSMERVLKLLAQYRPEQLQTRQNALDQAMMLFQPLNRMLTKAYGQDAALPIEAASASPFPDRVMRDMKRAAHPRKAKTSGASLAEVMRGK